MLRSRTWLLQPVNFLLLFSLFGRETSSRFDLKTAINFVVLSNELSVETIIFPDLNYTDERVQEILQSVTNSYQTYYSILPNLFNFNAHQTSLIDMRNAIMIYFVSDLNQCYNYVNPLLPNVLSKSLLMFIIPGNLDKPGISKALGGLNNVAFDSLLFIYSTFFGTLHEVYRIGGNSSLEVEEVSQYSPNIWYRRNDLQGIQFRAACAQNKPYIYKSDKDALRGTNIEIINILATDLNFTVSPYFVSDGKFGSFDSLTNTWNGVIGDLLLNKADIAIADLSVIKSRAEAVDFTQAIYQYQNRLYMQKPVQSLKWDTFVEVFNVYYWLLLVVMSAVLAAFLVGSQMLLHHNRGRGQDTLDHTSTAIAVGLALMTLDVRVNPSKVTTKILIFSICTMGALNYWSYNAGLVSFLTVELFQVPVNTLEDLLANQQYQIMVVKSTSHEAYFKETTETADPIAHQIWQKMMRDVPAAYTQNTMEAEKELLRDPKKVYFSQELSVETTMRTFPCQIISSTTTFYKLPMAFALPKNSPYLRILNQRLSVLRESGQLGIIFSRAKKDKEYCAGYQDNSGFNEIGYENIFTAFLLLASGVLAAVLINCCEKLYGVRKDNLP